MPRPRRRRRICFFPRKSYFKPAGVPLRELKEVVLNLEEYEAIRLKDLACLEQTECAEKMQISQPTFHRTLIEARRKIADAIINTKAIRIIQDEIK